MNSTRNQTLDLFYLSKSEWLIMLGASYTLDNFKLFVITPISAMGVILNSLSFVVLKRREFSKNKLYAYLRMLVLNSLAINLLFATAILVNTYLYSDFTNTKGAMIYFSYFYLPLASIAYCNGIQLNIVVTVERIIPRKTHWLFRQ
jgi:hypothetical protein